MYCFQNEWWQGENHQVVPGIFWSKRRYKQQCRIIAIPFITSILVPKVPFSNKILQPTWAMNFGHDLGAKKSCLWFVNLGLIWANLIFGYGPACWAIPVMLCSLIKCGHKMFNKAFRRFTCVFRFFWMGALVTKQQKDKRFCFVLRYVILGKLNWVVILMMRVQYRRQFFKRYFTYIYIYTYQ